MSDLVDLPDNQAVVLFDGVCNLCNASVNFIIDNDSSAYFKFASLQSEEAVVYLRACPSLNELDKASVSGDPQSVILLENGTCFQRSEAALRIARKLDGAWRLLYMFIIIPAPIRDTIYNWIARNRYKWFGKQDACRIPSTELRSRFLEGMVTPSA